MTFIISDDDEQSADDGVPADESVRVGSDGSGRRNRNRGGVQRQVVGSGDRRQAVGGSARTQFGGGASQRQHSSSDARRRASTSGRGNVGRKDHKALMEKLSRKEAMLKEQIIRELLLVRTARSQSGDDQRISGNGSVGVGVVKRGAKHSSKGVPSVHPDGDGGDGDDDSDDNSDDDSNDADDESDDDSSDDSDDDAAPPVWSTSSISSSSECDSDSAYEGSPMETGESQSSFDVEENSVDSGNNSNRLEPSLRCFVAGMGKTRGRNKRGKKKPASKQIPRAGKAVFNPGGKKVNPQKKCTQNTDASKSQLSGQPTTTPVGERQGPNERHLLPQRQNLR